MNARVKRFAAAAAVALVPVAGCGDTGPPAAGTATAPRTVGGSLPSPLDAATPTESQPSAPAPRSGAPRSVAGSLPPPGNVPPGQAAPPQPQAARAAATFSFDHGVLRPPSRTVTPSTPFDLTVAALDGKAHVVVLHTRTNYVLRPRPGQPASVTIQGLPAGTYTLTAGRQRARLEVAARP